MAALLEAAAAVIGEVGYDAATLTAIAARAGSSIGALYQYFPHKEALADALRVRYGEESADLWTPLAAQAARLGVRELVDRLCDVMVDFLEARPAYLPLFAVPSSYRRDPAARNRLREDFAALFREKRPDLTPREAYRIANVTFGILRAMKGLFTEENPRERRELLREFKQVLTAYLKVRLST